ncbi:MAG: Na(+)/H(+) antiporter subunit B [Gemmatimonadota bacterium]|nr:Na(+)/H(+) antiporter subunit B [Gemmatimonadota bacterium]
MTGLTILRVMAKTVIPFILLFALYVQFHGDYGPGGGFQAGVIFAAGLVLYSLVHGLTPVRRVAPERLIEILVAVGVLIFAGTGVVTMLLGGAFLEYGAFTPDHPEHGQHWGLLVIEFGVGVTVASVMITIFSTFASRGRG